jgi:hypothetical protein
MSAITIRSKPTNVSFTFKNNYSLSITIGPHAYCTSASQVYKHYEDSEYGIHALNAEIAIINPDGKFHRIAGQDDDVVGWVTPEQIVEVAYWVACGDMDTVAKILKHSKGKEKDNGTKSTRV